MFDQTDDLNSMFSLDDFAEVATFTISVGNTRDVNVIYDTGDGITGEIPERLYSLIVDTQKAFLRAPTANCTGIKRNTPVSFRGESWFVFGAPLNDQEGVSIMFISRDES